MNIRTRRISFYALVFLFIILSVSVVLYARGWRLDLWTFGVDRVGAIYIRSFPENADISLNGESVKNGSWFFQNGTFINNLFPKTYNLHLKAAGYHDWHESVSVQPMIVSEAKYAVLVPDTSEAIPGVVDPIEDFKTFNDGFMLKNTSGTWTWQTRSIPGDVILGWTSDYKKILSENSAQSTFYWTDADTFSTVNLNAILKKFGINQKTASFYINPDDTQRIFVWNTSRLWIVDPIKATAESIVNLTPTKRATSTQTIGTSLAAKRFLLAWTEYNATTSSSTLRIYDTALDTLLISPDAVDGEVTKLEWITGDKLVLLGKSGELLLYTVSKNELEKIASDVKSFEINKDASLLAALKTKSLEIVPLLKNNTDDYRQFRLPGNDAIKKIAWYKDGRHLFLYYPEDISFLDIDDRGLNNITVITKDIIRTEYNLVANMLYFLKNKELMGFEFSKN